MQVAVAKEPWHWRVLEGERLVRDSSAMVGGRGGRRE